MGVVKGIDGKHFPTISRDQGRAIMLTVRWGIFHSTIVRDDHTAPFNTIWKVPANKLPVRYFKGERDLYVAKSTLDLYPKDNPVCHPGPNEGKFVDVMFDHDPDSKCEGVVVTDRSRHFIILILTGVHEGRFVTSGECMYAVKPRTSKEMVND